MTEEEYQAEVQHLWTEMQNRADGVMNYLVTQPPIRLARLELRALLEWALLTGAEHPDIVLERMKRRKDKSP